MHECGLADHNRQCLRSRYRDIQAVPAEEEFDTSRRRAPDYAHGEDDHGRLLPLELIHGAHSNAGQPARKETLLEVARRNDQNVIGRSWPLEAGLSDKALFEQVADQAGDHLSLFLTLVYVVLVVYGNIQQSSILADPFWR